MTTAEEARQQVAELEEQLGFTLREWPVARLDQWTAHLRDLAGQLDVDLTDPQQAHAAFTGAYMLFAVMLAGSVKGPSDRPGWKPTTQRSSVAQASSSAA